ncbi:MAG: YwiC-like family protein [Anaerolineales bacterium]|jgi:hypothetical protein
MDISIKSESYLKRYIALPQDHGSWVFLLSPLLIGIFAGAVWKPATAYLIVAALAAFLIRQPMTMAIKMYSGRRSKRDLPAARFWIVVYGVVGIGALIGLISQGFTYLLYLALPGAPVFAWHLYLVSRRAERRQMGIELVACGVLALAAPAGYWVGLGRPDPMGWLLFGLVWLQSAASIVYAYLRLEQRALDKAPQFATRINMGARALLYTSFNLILVAWLSVAGVVPVFLPIPYAIQWLETILGTLRPAVGVKPTRIGLRQLIVSTIFTLAFIVAWRI